MCSRSAGAMPIPLSVTVNSTYRRRGAFGGRLVSSPVLRLISTCPFSGVNLHAFDSRFKMILSKFLGSIHISISGAEVWNFKSSFFTLVCCSKVSNRLLVKLTISAFLNMSDICPLSIFRISINWFTNCRMRSAFRCIVL